MPRQTDLSARRTDLTDLTDRPARPARPDRTDRTDLTVDQAVAAADFREFHTDLVERDVPSPAASPVPAPEILSHKDLDLSRVGFAGFHKAGKLYFAPFDAPVRVQTPVVSLATDLLDVDATLAVSGSFRRFVAAAEAALFDHAVAHPEWTGKTEAELRRYFKSFVTGDAVRVKVSDDLAVFDAAGGAIDPEEALAGAGVRCILELDGICFGRRGFGAMWTLTQAQLVDAPRLLISNRARRADEFS